MVKGTDEFKEARISGLTMEDARDITEEFLEWYKKYLENHFPTAKVSIGTVNAMLEELPMEINDIDG